VQRETAFPTLHLRSSAPLEQTIAAAERHYDEVAIMRRNQFEDGLYAAGHDADFVEAALRVWAEREIECKAKYLNQTLRFLSAARRDDWSDYETVRH